MSKGEPTKRICLVLVTGISIPPGYPCNGEFTRHTLQRYQTARGNGMLDYTLGFVDDTMDELCLTQESIDHEDLYYSVSQIHDYLIGQAVIVSGYGFGDKGINSAPIDVICSSDVSRKLVVIDPIDECELYRRVRYTIASK